MLHLVGYPHTRLDGGFDTCAYTQKIRKFRRMELGREMTVYGAAGADVVLLNEFERTSLFGQDDPGRLPAWPSEDQWRVFNARAIAEVTERATPGDLVLLAGGYSQRLVAAALPHLTVCEPFVGYEGIVSSFCAFESHAWRHYVYGKDGISDGRWFDAVIPNFFDIADFPPGGGDGGYLLFVGRLIDRKGVRVAADIAEAAGMPLRVAGPGDFDALDLPGDVTYLGVLDGPGRADAMGSAVALLAPTLYVEPFGGVAVEAQLCGTPAITPEYGAFSETVAEEWRIATLAEALDAVDCAANADWVAIRSRAIDRYSLEAVAPLFDRWFGRLEQMAGAGWYARPEPASV